MARKFVLDPTVLESLVVKYKEGASLKELAQEVECSIPTISRKLKAAGVTIRPKGKKPKKAKEEEPKVAYPTRPDNINTGSWTPVRNELR